MGYVKIQIIHIVKIFKSQQIRIIAIKGKKDVIIIHQIMRLNVIHLNLLGAQIMKFFRQNI